MRLFECYQCLSWAWTRATRAERSEQRDGQASAIKATIIYLANPRLSYMLKPAEGMVLPVCGRSV